MSDVGAWCAERFAQELVARGYSAVLAISMTRDFAREWEVEAARLRGMDEFWREHIRDEPPKDESKRWAWSMELRRMAWAAGEKAAVVQRDFLDEARK